MSLAMVAGGLAVGAAGGAWLPVESVAQTPGVSSEPAVAVGTDGTVWVAWQDGADVLVAHDAGSGWSLAERVGRGFGADIAMTAGVPHVVFVSDSMDRLDLVYSFRETAGWVLPRTVSSTLSLGAGPALAVAGSRRFVTWSDSGRLFFARSDDGAVWSVQPVLIHRLPVDGAAPDVASDDPDGADLVWHATVDGVDRIRHAEWRAGSWSLAEDLTSDEDPVARSPSLALLPGGERLVAWWAGDGTEGRTARAATGSTGWWSPPTVVSGAVDVAGPPQAAGHAVGADLAWPVESGGLRYRPYRLRAGWLAEEPVSAGTTVDVAIAATADDAFVAWSAPTGVDNWDISLRRRAAAPQATPTDPFTATPATSATATVALGSHTPTPLPTVTATPTTAPSSTPLATAAIPDTRTPLPTPTGLATGTPAPSASATATASATGSPSPRPTLLARTATATTTATTAATRSPPPSPTTTARTLYLPWLTLRRQARSTPFRQAAAPLARHIGGQAQAGPVPGGTVSPQPEIWRLPEDIARLPGDTWQLAVAVDALGQVHVVWEEGDVLRHSVRVAGAWQAPRLVAYGEAPSLALDAKGELHALFANSFEENQDIYFVSYRDGAWSLPENVSGSSTFSTSPVLRTGDLMTPLVATWSEIGPTGTSPLVYYGWWDGRWHFTPVSQARGVGATVAMDDGGPVLAWHARAAADRPFDVYASRGQDARGRAWALPENVSDTSEEDSVVPALALDPHAWHVAWREGPATAVGVAYARRYEAGWGEIEALSGASNGPPVVLAAANGTREVVWLADTAVWSARGFGDAGPWQTAQLPPAGAGAQVMAAAGDVDGGLHLVWAEAGEGGSAVLRYARRQGCTTCRVMVPLAVKRW